jgi:hypothetical protein
MRLNRALRRLSGSTSNDESWPTWQRYAAESRGLDLLWKRPNADALDLFRRVLGSSALDDVSRMKREQPFLFVGLLTIKLWLDQR